jgi:hypothetical protein
LPIEFTNQYWGDEFDWGDKYKWGEGGL